MSEKQKWWVWPARVTLALTSWVWFPLLFVGMVIAQMVIFMGWAEPPRCHICKQPWVWGRRSCTHKLGVGDV